MAKLRPDEARISVDCVQMMSRQNLPAVGLLNTFFTEGSLNLDKGVVNSKQDSFMPGSPIMLPI